VPGRARPKTKPRVKKRNYERREERVRAELPVKLERAKGVTRDVSRSGAFFETDATYRVGSPVHFAIRLETPWGPAHFDCRGKIVRVERHDQVMGVAVQFNELSAPPRPAPAPPRRR
jgi:hypothetical protein